MDTHLAALTAMIGALGGLVTSVAALVAVLKSRRTAEAAHRELTTTLVDKIDSAAAQVTDAVSPNGTPPAAA